MNFAQIVGKSASLRRVLKQVETVALKDSTELTSMERRVHARLGMKRSTLQLRIRRLGTARPTV
jgi:DNA-binding NtrC family response regulator